MSKTIKISYVWVFCIFAVLILGVSLFANTYGATDAGDYVGVAKGLAGQMPTKMRSNHSWVYGLFLSFFLNIIHASYILKLVNVFWVLAIGVLLLYSSKKKTAFGMFVLSPVTWYMAPSISPILPTAFLLFASYLLLRKYETEKSLWALIGSGALLGLACVLWDTMLFLSVFFIVCFFYSKTVKSLFIFLISFGVLFSVRFIVDYALFRLPFYSLARMLGGNLSAFFHLGNYTDLSYATINYLLLFIAITPLFVVYFVRFVRATWRERPAEIVFMILVMCLFVLNPQPRYLFGVAPLFLFLLAPYTRNNKERIIEIVISILVILYLLIPFFGATYEYKLGNDMNQIARDFPHQTFLAGGPGNSDLAIELGMYYWGNDVKEIINYQEYDLWQKNETSYQTVHIASKPRVNDIRTLWIDVSLVRSDNRTYEDIPLLIDTNDTPSLEGYHLVKSYSELNVFGKDTYYGLH